MDITIAKANTSDCQDIVDIANAVYFETEKEFWKEGYYRISKKECLSYILKQKVLAAKLDSKLIGFVLANPKTSDSYEFSMLTTHFSFQKKGVGKLLVNRVFEIAKTQGYTFLEIEVLSPVHWTHSQKEFLTQWYTSLGFEFISSFSFASKYPTHTQFMKCDLEFKLYRKKL